MQTAFRRRTYKTALTTRAWRTAVEWGPATSPARVLAYRPLLLLQPRNLSWPSVKRPGSCAGLSPAARVPASQKRTRVLLIHAVRVPWLRDERNAGSHSRRPG